jgi:hypothetical protein
VDVFSFDTSEINRLFKGTNYAVVSVSEISDYYMVKECLILILNSPLWQGVFNMVERRIDKDTSIVPSARFDSDRFMNQMILSQGFARNSDSYSFCKHPWQ